MSGSTQAPRARVRQAALAAAAVAGIIGLAACGIGTAGRSQQAQGQSAQGQAMGNPDLDPGTSLGGVPAPGFRLTNQFGQQISLSSFRGKVVILAFTDSQCTTICPLTTVSMLQARELLGRAGDQVQLLSVDANPKATSVSDVMGYSQSHGMVNQWDFLTGTVPALQAVWKAYHIYVQIQSGQVDHTPALFVIDQRGGEQKVYLTTMAYASVGQAAQILATEASSLLPGHPKLASARSLAYIGGLSPASRVTLAAVPAGTSPAGADRSGSGPSGTGPSGSGPSGSVTLGPGRAHLVMFFATWLSQTSDLGGELTGLNAYVRAARAGGLPGLVAVDEAATEPSAGTVLAFLAHLGKPLGYPVALDTTGRLADGYGVQDQPWFVLTSAAGKILWTHDGWLPVSAVEAAARRAASAR